MAKKQEMKKNKAMRWIKANKEFRANIEDKAKIENTMFRRKKLKKNIEGEDKHKRRTKKQGEERALSKKKNLNLPFPPFLEPLSFRM